MSAPLSSAAGCHTGQSTRPTSPQVSTQLRCQLTGCQQLPSSTGVRQDLVTHAIVCQAAGDRNVNAGQHSAAVASTLVCLTGVLQLLSAICTGSNAASQTERGLLWCTCNCTAAKEGMWQAWPAGSSHPWVTDSHSGRCRLQLSCLAAMHSCSGACMHDKIQQCCHMSTHLLPWTSTYR